MLLSYRFLADVANVNSFEISPTAEINAGDTQDLYFQLVDTTSQRREQGYNPPGRRYIPPTGSSLVVTLTNLDTGPSVASPDTFSPRINPTAPARIVRTAVQPFGQDGSVWRISLLASDPLRGTVQLKVALAEPSRTLTVAGVPGLFLRVR